MTLGQTIRKIGKSMVRDSKNLYPKENTAERNIDEARADQFNAHNKPEGQQEVKHKGLFSESEAASKTSYWRK